MALEIPGDLRLTLRAGTVYYFQHRELTSPEPHYFIVANSDPLRDQVLLLAVASSKVENVRQRRRQMPTETVVEISPAEYVEFRVPSVVDCNRVFRKSLIELIDDRKRGLLTPKKDLPRELLLRIQTGIKASPLVEEDAKALIK
jgi:hypothetical protein